MARRGGENVSAFYITKSFFKKNSGAENLLLRVHERYSDLSGGGNFRERPDYRCA